VKTEITIRVYGEISGFIWMPPIECTKEFNVRLERIPRNSTTRTAYSHGWPMEITCLRDALLHVTNDGDFQSCSIDWAFLQVTHKRGNKSVIRTWEIRGTNSDSDCFTHSKQREVR
jgi:hypothetical protein